jgi:hypothetical protein
MILAYLDESGNTGSDLTDETQPFHYVGALLVPEKEWAASKSGVEAVVEFAIQSGYDSAPSECELHGKEILQGKQGWRKVSVANRLEILKRCLDVAEERDLKIVRGSCNKKLLRERYTGPEHPHSIALWLCLERIARVAKQRSELAVMIADDCSSSHKELSRETLLRYRQKGAPFGPTVDFSWLVDVIHFMPSNDSRHIQLCDVIMYVHQRYARTRDARIEALYWRCHHRQATEPGVIPY